MATEVAAAYVELGARIDGLERGLAAANAQLVGWSKKADATAARSAAAFKKFAKVGALGVAAGLTGAVVVAASFEKRMKAVQSVTGATQPQIMRLAEAAKRLGAAQQYGARGARAVADAQVELGKAGLTTTQIIGGGLQAALSLATAGNLQVADAAAYTANAMNLFSLRAKDAGQVADALATAANVTTADVGDFGMALTQGGSAAKAAGLSFNETMTALTALAKAGIKGSDAGTSLKTSLLQLINPTSKQAKAAREAGLSFIDASGKMRSLADISGQLRSKTEGMTKAQRTALFATLAGTDGVRTLLSLYQAGPAALGRWSAQLGRSGSAARTASVMNQGAAASFQRFKAVMENLAIDVGTALLPALTRGAQALADFVSRLSQSGEFRSFLADLGSLASTAFGALKSAVQASVGPLQTIFSVIRSIAQSPLGPAIVGLVAGFMAFGKVVALVTALKAAFTGLGAAMLTPLGAVQMLVAAMAGLGFAIAQIQSVSEEAASEQNAFAQAMRNAASAATAATNASNMQQDAMLQIRQANEGVTSAERALAAAKRQTAAIRARAITDTYSEAQRNRDLQQALGRQRSAQLQVDQARRQSSQGIQQSLAALRTENAETRKRLGTLQSQTQLESKGAAIIRQLSSLTGADADTRRAATQQATHYSQALLATLSAQQQSAQRYRDMAGRAREAAASIQGNSTAAKAGRQAHLNLARSFDQAAGRASGAAGRTAALMAALLDAAGAARGGQGALAGFGSSASSAGSQASAGAAKVRELAAAMAAVNSKTITLAVNVVKTEIREVVQRITRQAAGSDKSGPLDKGGGKGGVRPNQQERLAIADAQLGVREARAQLSGVLARRKAKKKSDRPSGLEIARARFGVTQAQVGLAQARQEPAQRARGRLRDANRGITEALSANYLAKFDEEAQGRLDSIRARFEDGVQKIGDTFQIIPGVFTQIEQRTKAQTDGVQAALATELQGIEDKYAGLFKGLKSEQKAAGKALEAKYRQMGKDLEAEFAALTPAEAMLKSLDDAQGAKDTLYQVQDAEQALREAIQKQMPEGEIRDRMRAVERARYQEQRAGLEAQAGLERDARDAELEARRQALADQQEAEQEAADAVFEQRRANLEAQQEQERDAAETRAANQIAALEAQGAAERAWQEGQLAAELAAQEAQDAEQRRGLKRRLSQLGQSFLDMRGMTQGNFNTMIGQAQWFAEALGTSGRTAGQMLADGLLDKMPRIRDAAQTVAAELARYLKLNSPAEKGPLSQIDDWWAAMPGTLAAGIDMERMNRTMAELSGPGGEYRGRGAAQVAVEVIVQDSTFAGMSREQADRVARDLKAALDRQVRLG